MKTFKQFVEDISEGLTVQQKAAELKAKRKNILVKDKSNFQEHIHKLETKASKDGQAHYFKDRIRAKNKHEAVFSTQVKYHKMGYKVHDVSHKGIVKEKNKSIEESAAWQRKEGKSESGGLNRKGIMSYRRENPGSKLSMAVTTKPSKLKKGSKAANRRKSFCARMGGMKKRLTSAKTARDPNSRINKALRKWNC